MKKKILTIAMAAVMSVGVFASNVTGVSAAVKGNYTISYAAIPKYEFSKPNDYFSDDFRYVYVKKELESNTISSTFQYDIMVVPKGHIAKVCYTGTEFKVMSSNSRSSGLTYSYTVNVSKFKDGTTSKSTPTDVRNKNSIYFAGNLHELIGAVNGVEVWHNGDVNMDGTINITDVEKVAAHVKGKKILNNNQAFLADVNEDGVVNIADVTKIAAHVKGNKRLV